MLKNAFIVAGCALSIVLATSPAPAHHSAAMFDETKFVTLAGTVKEFQWTQPHGWIVLMVPDAKGGAPKEWRAETGAPTLMMRMGLQKSDIPTGAKITIRVHPLRDGRAAGEFVDGTRADGTPLIKRMGPPPGPPPAG